MTTAVFFDVDGTLVRFEEPYREVLARAFRTFGVAPDDAVLDAYDEAFFDGFGAFADAPYRDAAAAAFEAGGVDADPEAFAGTLLEVEFAATVVEDGTRDLLDRLGERHRLGVLSNGVPEVQRGKLERHGLADAFDEHVYSYDVGAHKPDPAVFEAAARRVDADRYVYVADDEVGDLDPAREAGWLGVHLDADAPDGRARVPDFDSLASLGELFDSGA